MQKALVIIGAVLLLAGLAWPWLQHVPLGRLPGDIVVQREGFTFYFPITSMAVVSVVLSVMFWLLRR